MLAVSAYDKKYVDQCEARMKAQLAAYQSLVVAARTPIMLSALAQFEALFLSNLTLALDGCFAHRTRALEGKDGNPLNEVRMLCTSILRHKGLLAADSTIKYKPEASVLKLRIGELIRMDAAQFSALATAFFAEIRRRFRAKAVAKAR